MLDRAHRLRAGSDFAQVSRRGRRAHTAHLIVHLLRTDAQHVTRVGFVTSKAVGNAVTRNLVKRRLREIARELLREHPSGLDVVVRARPGAAEATFAQLREQVLSAASDHRGHESRRPS
ncbi:ribonuclease P protein component [Pseudoclavibacter soli]|uniref:ribonuclease P protein component n=1 Tax=Pseudoclavibacter soli TaxID=452623 RepID=UPI00040E3A1A|nr:ribonuclease P protein component [Pseudoclavibacter soli]